MLATPMYSVGTSQRGYELKNDTKLYTPGPGTYHLKEDDITKPFSPRWKLGTDARSNSTGDAYPGPSDYFDESKKTDKEKERERKLPNSRKPGKSFLGKHPAIDNHNFDAVAPNTYKPQKMHPSLPTYSFGYKPDPLTQPDVPGPGAYLSDNDTLMKFAKAPKIGTSKRSEIRDNLVPGPGKYLDSSDGQKIDSVLLNPIPNWGFGTSKRGGMHNSSVVAYPGPGHYPNKNSIGGNHHAVTISGKRTESSDKTTTLLTPGPGAYAIISDKVFRNSAPSFSAKAANLALVLSQSRNCKRMSMKLSNENKEVR